MTDALVALSASGLMGRKGTRPLFSDVSVTVRWGEILRIVGPNGSGKSTLLRQLCGLLVPCAGRVAWQGIDIARHDGRFREQMVFLGHADGLKADLRVWENVCMLAALQGKALSKTAAGQVLQHNGLAHLSDLPARNLSQGQRRQVALARLPVVRRRLWLLDEPFAFLDARASDRLCVAIRQHVAAGGLTVYSTHREDDVQPSQSLNMATNIEVPC